MREIRTEVDIAAPPEDVWRVAADFRSYAAWNPFMPLFEAEARPGTKGRLSVAMPGNSARSMTVSILDAKRPRELRWRGALLGQWLFSATHIIELSARDGGTHVVNREEYRGILAPLLVRGLWDSLPGGYEAMNAALRARVEGSA